MSTESVFEYKKMISGGFSFDPGELIQIDTEKNLDILLNVQPSSIKNIIIVGAWRGNEVASFLQYPNAIIYCFEPNQKNFEYLVDRWKHEERVICFNEACASFDGESVLNEANLTGNDSLLPIRGDSKTGLRVIKTHKVKTRKLDSVEEFRGKDIDLLWADVQGYELEVLRGATNTLKRTKSLFLEVYRKNFDYQNGVEYEKVVEFLNNHDFALVAQGLDNDMGGNAFFLRENITTNAFSPESYNVRIADSLTEIIKKKKLLRFALVKMLARLIPVRIKNIIRRIMKM